MSPRADSGRQRQAAVQLAPIRSRHPRHCPPPRLPRSPLAHLLPELSSIPFGAVSCAPGGSPRWSCLRPAATTTTTVRAWPPRRRRRLSSTSLDGAIALVWSDNPFQADPDIFGNYRVYSTSYDIDAGPVRLGMAGRGHHGGARVPGRGARQRGAALLLGDRGERGRRRERAVAARGATRRGPTRATSRSSAAPATPNGSGFRFWDDLNDDGSTQSGELGMVRSANVAGHRLLRGSRRQRRRCS